MPPKARRINKATKVASCPSGICKCVPSCKKRRNVFFTRDKDTLRCVRDLARSPYTPKAVKAPRGAAKAAPAIVEESSSDESNESASSSDDDEYERRGYSNLKNIYEEARLSLSPMTSSPEPAEGDYRQQRAAIEYRAPFNNRRALHPPPPRY